jgi:hypothetical protein
MSHINLSHTRVKDLTSKTQHLISSPNRQVKTIKTIFYRRYSNNKRHRSSVIIIINHLGDDDDDDFWNGDFSASDLRLATGNISLSWISRVDDSSVLLPNPIVCL